LKLGDKMVFSVPNFDHMIKTDQFPLNFEHTVLITDHFIRYLLAKHGFDIEIEHMYLNHSKFYSVVYKSDVVNDSEIASLYDDYKKKILENYNTKKTDVENINKIIGELDSDAEVYLYSGHIFSQYLINFGLNVDKICCILDNDPKKEHKRLYGTNLIVKNPSTIKDDKRPYVILRSGVYDREISMQLLEINPNTIII
jgi:hypothetical protein